MINYLLKYIYNCYIECVGVWNNGFNIVLNNEINLR